MYCSNCGNKVPDDAKVCPECGQDLTYESNKTARLSSRSGRRGKAAAAVIGVILALALAECLWLFAISPKKRAVSSSPAPAPHDKGGVTALISQGQSQ